MRKILATIVAAALASGAQAATLALGNNTLSGTTVAAQPQLAGTVLADESTAIVWDQAGSTLTADVQSRVVRSSVDGTLDFYWRLTNISFSGRSAPEAIGTFRIGKFGNLIGYNSDYRTDGLGSVGPDTAYVFPDPGFVNFNFANGLLPGDDSLFIFIDTDAKSFKRTAEMDIANTATTSISGLYSTFAPGVPEPAQWAFMIGGFALVGAVGRRRGTAVASA